MKKAVVLLSGGQDSTTCLYWAIKKFDEVKAITFDYGQRHLQELDFAEYHTQKNHISLYVTKIPVLNDISINSLTQQDISVDSKNHGSERPNTMVQGRNLLFLTYAAIYARSQHIHHLVTGVSEADFSNYPDCRNDFITSAEKTISLSMDYKFTIHTPLMWKSKAEVWDMAHQLNVLSDIEKNTLTCYNGIAGKGCGDCPACYLRDRGWKQFKKELNR